MSNQENAGGEKYACFFIPFLGLILYLIWKDEKPVAANECGKFAIYGAVAWFLFSMLSGALGFMAVMSAFDTY
jgi:hypothetical protein